MDFQAFVKQLTKTQDSDIQDFIDIYKICEFAPVNSDPRVLARYLHLKINKKQTSGFQKLMVLYRENKNNELTSSLKADDLAFQEAIHYIEELQKSNPDYKG